MSAWLVSKPHIDCLEQAALTEQNRLNARATLKRLFREILAIEVDDSDILEASYYGTDVTPVVIVDGVALGLTAGQARPNRAGAREYVLRVGHVVTVKDKLRVAYMDVSCAGLGDGIRSAADLGKVLDPARTHHIDGGRYRPGVGVEK